MGKIVVSLDKYKCNQGCILQIIKNFNTVKINEKFVIDEESKKFIPVVPGTPCANLSKGGTVVPCNPTIIKWNIFNRNVKIAGKKIITTDDKAQCQWGGELSFLMGSNGNIKIK